MPAPTKTSGQKADYQTFLASLDVYTIVLARSAFRIERDDFFEGSEDNRMSFRLSSKPLTIAEKHFDVRSTLNLEVTNEKLKKTVLQFAATFELHFHGTPISDEFVRDLCSSEIRLIVWPYFREYVSDVTARMYIPPIVLPLSERKRKPTGE
jgi:preprotein translocase subunit SecB